MTISKIMAPALLLLLSGCSWVDSTGRQDTASTVTVNPTQVLLNSSESFPIEENTQRTIVFNGANNRVTNWNWNLLEGQADTQQCNGIDGFDQSIASNALSQSCAIGNECELKIEEVVIDDITQFEITTPHLRAPAALEVYFSAQSDAGVFFEQRQTLCAIAVNNAPVAVDDPISIISGTRLVVSGDDVQSLLANDSDDNDVRNMSLRVDPTPLREPRFAESFELFPDGGFIYEPTSNAPISTNGSVSDSFTYLVSDGNKTSSATAIIKISDFNSAPELIDTIPEMTVLAGDDANDPEIAFLQSYFTDAENNLLNFSVADGSLPESGNIYITQDGVLEGYASEEDSGLYYVNLTVSDSLESVDTHFFLSVVSDRGSNNRPTARDISNRTVTGEFTYDVSVFFNDFDGDHLYFSAINLPPGLAITPDGVIIGTATSANRGNWLIRVKAEDGNGGFTDDGFRLRIR